MTLMGPVLYFRGAEAGAWRLAALVVAQVEPPPLLTSTYRAMPLRLATRYGCSLWRYDFALPIGRSPCCHEYRVGDQSWRVHLPATGALRMAYMACNGTEVKNVWTCGRSATSAGCTWRRSMREMPFTCCCTVAINSMPMRYGTMFRHSPSGGNSPGVTVEKLPSHPKWPKQRGTSSGTATVTCGANRSWRRYPPFHR